METGGIAGRSALRPVQRSVDKLIAFAINARCHAKSQVALIAGSIRDFGFKTAVLVDVRNGALLHKSTSGFTV